MNEVVGGESEDADAFDSTADESDTAAAADHSDEPSTAAAPNRARLSRSVSGCATRHSSEATAGALRVFTAAAVTAAAAAAARCETGS